MKILVCGGREFTDAGRVARALETIGNGASTVVIHGGARGADTLADAYARSRRWEVRVYPALWDVDGRAAGPTRNRRMLDVEHPDIVVAFPGGAGTADCIRRAQARGIPVQLG